MSGALAITHRELRSFLNSALAYFYTVIFLLVCGVFLFWFGQFFSVGQANMRLFFEWLPWFFLLFIPPLTMRMWAEERKLRTDEVLLTLPISSVSAVVGKFFACVALIALALLCTCTIPITLAILGDPDWGPILGGYCGALLLGAAMAALGLFISALFSDQSVAFLVSLVVMILLNICGFSAIISVVGIRVAEVLHFFSTYYHFQGIARGVVDSTDVLFFLSMTLLFLILNGLVVEVRRR